MDIVMNWLGTIPGAVAQGLVWGIMAVGLYITFKILDVADLTVDGSICTGAAVCTVLLTKGVPIAICMPAAFVAGCIAGFVTGILHTRLKIPAILAGILTQLMLWSANLVIMGRANVAISKYEYGDKVLISASASQIVKTLLILFGIVIVLNLVLYRFFGTQFGMSIRATGSNPQMSRAQGINTNMTTVFGLALSNGIVALSGSLLAQQQGAADINMGKGAIVIGLAAVIVGEAIVAKLPENLFVKLSGVVLGAAIYWIVFQTVIFLGLPSELLKLLSAIVVALFLGLPHIKSSLFQGKKKGDREHA